MGRCSCDRTRMQLIRTLATWRPDLSGYRDPVTATKISLKSLARRYLELHDEIADLQFPMHALVEELAPDLLARVGIGYEPAAQLLITAGHNPERLTSEASFAMLCGAAPLPASSGMTTRHRLNRGGDRAANSAAHDRHQPLADGPRYPGLRRQEEDRATLQPGDPALPQEVHRPRGLLRPAQPAPQPQPGRPSGLTDTSPRHWGAPRSTTPCTARGQGRAAGRRVSDRAATLEVGRCGVFSSASPRRQALDTQKGDSITTYWDWRGDRDSDNFCAAV